ncbi:MAG: cytochrome c-type biogenesis protein CcmH [Actinomycetota bacterium]|jgi:cytochrome c-type biogenesis protein CcmH|nr:cytochrome c-type biogenesis protein CcmH [Actinomycetota bacterium]
MNLATLAASRRRIVSSRIAWAVLAVVAIAFLAVGSIHPVAPSRQARIAALESEIKCPSCVDLTIAQSDAAAAIDLRAEVTHMVDTGASDAAIKARVVAQYGTTALEIPLSKGIDALIFLVPAIAVILVGGVLLAFFWRRRRLPMTRGPSQDDEVLVAAARQRREPDPGS